ncbi:ribokinase [Catenulispora sp. NF23]|uniref:Ribokinase n=1 Tax=Catenulispora pinistramenti TaxID=2705254 RepID=A0ABS5KW68_9ACTN|nr:ribokinase [Catenulispora pinistramenti]MBS2537925.1 ribokinase [Catenulispora pinistramenti]MBS2550302.1 ribokinase [Catenulispora pinistramenti]
MEPEPQRVVVVGSVNVDEVVGVAALPTPGETVLGRERATGLGGKGANQAVAAAMAGGTVALVGAVGTDPQGEAVLEQLAKYGVDTSLVARLDKTATGRALVILSEAGENEIIVIGGANQALDERALNRDTLHDAAVLVLQGEVAPSVNRAALRLAAEAGVRAVVNLAPVHDLGAELAHADPLVVNEIEAGQLLGADLATVHDVTAAAPQLRGLARSVLVTLGASGAVLITRDSEDHLPAPRPTRVRDTTGAGDALVGVLAAALAQGFELRPAVERAIRAASLSVAEVGAAASYEAFRGQLT